MSCYVLIHGAWHGGWCWHRVVPLLEALGHRVQAPDLPGPCDDITLDEYVDAVCDALAAAPEPVVLVGHSLGHRRAGHEGCRRSNHGWPESQMHRR